MFARVFRGNPSQGDLKTLDVVLPGLDSHAEVVRLQEGDSQIEGAFVDRLETIAIGINFLKLRELGYIPILPAERRR